MTQTENIEIKARRWATDKHYETNHKYDGKPYDVHLWMVHDVAKMFIHFIPLDKQDVVLAACWLHDTIEDCRVTYNDVKKEFGEEIAEIVYALTNEKGRTRKDRANAAYYKGIRNTDFAVFIKLCDRIANVKYSFENKSSMMSAYSKESDEFKFELDNGYYPTMWDYLQSFYVSTLFTR